MEPKLSISDAADLQKISVQGIHKNVKNKGMALKRFGNKLYFDHNSSKEYFNFKFKKKIISVQMLKGGVGKTTLVQSICVRASLYGAKVLCIDLDQQANLTQAFNQTQAANSVPILIDLLEDNHETSEAILKVLPGIDLIPSRMDNAVLNDTLMIKNYALDKVYLNILKPVINDYDLIIFDCPPALGHSVAASTLISDLVLTPITPTGFSLSGLKVLKTEWQKLERNFGKKITPFVLMNNFDNRKKKAFETYQKLIHKYKDILFSFYVRTNQEFENVIDEDGLNSITLFEGLSKSTAKQDIDLITRELLGFGEVA